MINMLPPETKRQIRAARMNVILRNYCFLLLAAAVAVGAAFGSGIWLAHNDKKVAEIAFTDSQQTALEYQSTRKAAEDFAKDLTLAKTILASDVSLTQTVTDIAAVVPGGVVLNNLTLGGVASAQNTPIDISGRAKSNQAIIQLRISLEDSAIFENVSIANISRADPGSIDAGDPIGRNYPFSVTLKAQFTKKPAAAASPDAAAPAGAPQ